VTEEGARQADMNWFAVLAHHATRAPDKAMTVFEGAATTYGEMAGRVAALAGGLSERGVGRGDVVALLSYNRPEFLETITPEYVETIYLTSPLHDIGKVGIPDCILLKPGRLTESEFNVMKLHTVIGGETLGAAAQQYPGVGYLRMAADIALTHHEKFNGSGYPSGLKGEAIPLSGRIVGLADVYDALTSKRVYKAAFTHDVARNIIVNDREKHFDGRIVDAFLAREEEFRNTAQTLAEAGSEIAPVAEKPRP